jgi:hypothetical protein
MELEGSQIAAAVRPTGRRVRVDDFGEGGGPIQAAVRELGMRSSAGAWIVVDGELWGVMVAAPPAGNSIPEDVEQCLGEFTEPCGSAGRPVFSAFPMNEHPAG